ncbi:MAG: ATP-binding protein, partial [Patescibacteria group bacterium]
VSTVEPEHQVAGLIKEIKEKGKYKNVHFFGPKKIIELLIASDRIEEIKGSSLVTKKILAITYFGDFYIFLTADAGIVVPNKFLVFNAKNGEPVIEESLIEDLQSEISEIKDIMPAQQGVLTGTTDKIQSQDIQSVAEVPESNDWSDYLPASSKHFVGRKDIKKSIFSLFERVISKEDSRRVFYIEGKSGWGKSSIAVDLRGVVRKNPDLKNKYLVFAVDSRSALSNNFVALVFEKMLDEVASSKFLAINPREIKIASSFDVLSSDSVEKFLLELEKSGKSIIIIFDQFEDVFRIEELFKSFYKFLTDVKSRKSNLLIGFSWKTETNIPIESPAYSLWQQAKGDALRISVPRFNAKEVSAIIKQLEEEIGQKIGNELENKLKEISQGFPWFIKKLCIHVYFQIKSGISEETLLEQELNVEQLFKKDLERLSPEEAESLCYIAKKGYDGTSFDVSEVDDAISSKVIDCLVDKRLIIKSGLKYNVFWDIFRDYLVTDEVPPIGESYILRQSPNTCGDLFLLLEQGKSVDELRTLLPNAPTTKTIWNQLRDLIALGLVTKSQNGKFKFSDVGVSVAKSGFKEFLKNKFEKHSVYLKMKKVPNKKLNHKVVTDCLKETFRAIDAKDKTWDFYTYTLMAWFSFAGLDLGLKHFGRRHFRTSPEKIFINVAPKKAFDVLIKIKDGQEINRDRKNSYNRKALAVLAALGLISHSDNKNFILTEEGKNIFSSEDAISEFCSIALEIPKIQSVFEFVQSNKKCSVNDILNNLSELFSGIKEESSKKQQASVLNGWAKFILKNKKG